MPIPSFGKSFKGNRNYFQKRKLTSSSWKKNTIPDFFQTTKTMSNSFQSIETKSHFFRVKGRYKSESKMKNFSILPGQASPPANAQKALHRNKTRAKPAQARLTVSLARASAGPRRLPAPAAPSPTGSDSSHASAAECFPCKS